MGSSSRNKEQLFDPIRNRWVRATPEERVRQQWICHMISSLGFPKELFAIEKALKELPHLQEKKVPDRRLDLLILSGLRPLLLIECKVDPLGEKEKAQVIGYNHYVGAQFIAVVNQTEALFGYRQENTYAFHPFLPPFQELKQWANCQNT